MLPTIAKLASKHKILPLKKYGQNFIFDKTLCDKIVKYSGAKSDDFIVEIGPGVGGLTRSILEISPSYLVAIETDSRCFPLLEEIKTTYPALSIKRQDALKVKLFDIVSEYDLYDQKVNVIANLPYNIGTVILTNYLKEIDLINSMTFMLQKEVVDRIVAEVGTKAYGRLSIICQIICNVHKCFDVSPNAFYPKPKVSSSIVKLLPKDQQLDAEILRKMEHITQAAFSNRRKMIKSSLKKILPNIEDILTKLNIDPKFRAEDLTPQDYINLTKLS